MRIQSTARGGGRAAAVDAVRPTGVELGNSAPAMQPGSVDPRVVVALSPDHPDAQRARDVRAELLGRWSDDEVGRPRAVAFVALDRGSQLAEIATNVAVGFAQLGRQTLLVDADMGEPLIHELLHVPNGHGLADVLEGRADVGGAVLPSAVPGLSVMPTGTIDDRARDAVERRPLLERLDERVLRTNVLVLAIAGHSAQALATTLAHFDCVVPVVRRGRTKMRQLQALVDALATRGVEAGGVVVSG